MYCVVVLNVSCMVVVLNTGLPASPRTHMTVPSGTPLNNSLLAFKSDNWTSVLLPLTDT